FAKLLGCETASAVYGCVAAADIAEADAAAVLEFSCRRGDGEPIWIEARFEVIVWDGAPAELVFASDITQRKVVASGQAGDEQVRQFLDESIFGIFICQQDKIVYANQAFVAIYGYGSPSEVVALESVACLEMPAERRRLRDYMVRRGRGEAAPAVYDLQGLRKDGSSVWVENRVQEISWMGRPSQLVIASDITERREAIDALRKVEAQAAESHALLVDAIEALSEGFALIGPDGRLVMTNQRFLDLYQEIAHLYVPGATFEEIARGVATSGLVPEAKGREEAWIKERLYRHTSLQGPFERRLGPDRWLLVDERRASDGSIVSVCRDITDLKHAEMGLQKLNEKLEQRVEIRTRELTKANQAKSEFLSSMSHELCTPLNAILGFAQLLRDYSDQPLSEEQKLHLDQVLEGGQHLLTLVNDVLDLSKIETGQLDISLARIDPIQALRECMALVQPLAEHNGITLTVSDSLPVDSLVRADMNRLKQVLLNLLSNAVKYNREKGGVSVDAKVNEQGVLRIEVADTGPGIPPERHNEVFRPFSRLGMETSKIEGTGIGLTISRQLMESMAGKLDFTSRAGEGSTFWIELPLTDAKGGPAAPAWS
ncbi:MAG: ATP-binding protein, partial [Alphaproteobacteria bacterium]|nr:ATP-binding protein [Alphaproteobacteria bacterium]